MNYEEQCNPECKVNFSTYQNELFSALNNEASIIVDAKAGSGKTTTIVEAANRLDTSSSILFLAFNRSIVEELKSRLPRNVNCATFNSVGWRSWLSFTGKKFVKVDAAKTRGIIRERFPIDDQEIYAAFVNKMVALAKSNGITLDSDIDDWYSLADHHGVFVDNEDADYTRAYELCRKTLNESIRIANFVCDFDDQIYMPWLRRASFQKYDCVFIDEAQDTSPIQADLISRMVANGGKIIAVGDPAQAIYGFRGADHNAMNNIRDTFGAVTMPLSISYRCAKAIIREAQKYVPDIEAFEHAPEGSVKIIDQYSIDDFDSKTAILCRNNAPLIEMAYQIIARGKGVNILGRDIGGGLKNLINKMKAVNVENLSVKLNNWLDKESEKLRNKDQEDKIQILEDKVTCINVFIDNLPEEKNSISDLINAIDALFSSSTSGVVLSSVHKSKGSEWDKVFILDFEKLMPSPYAKKEWQRIQENNLIYVAITRAKKELGYISSNCWK